MFYKRFKTLLIVIIVAQLLALLPWPYAYYQLLKWLVTGGLGYMAYSLHEQKKYRADMFIFIAIAVLFNPIRPIYLTREIWSVIDVVVAGYLGIKLFKK